MAGAGRVLLKVHRPGTNNTGRKEEGEVTGMLRAREEYII